MAHDNHHHDETVPAELQDLHQRLQAYSAAWQRHLPSPDRLITQYNTLREQQRMGGGAPQDGENSAATHRFRHTGEIMRNMPNRWGGIIAAVVITALLITTFVVIQTHAKKNIATIPTLHVTASQGWVRPQAIAFGKQIAFAPNAPLTGYVCGNTASSQESAPIRMSVTHDGGLTWHELPATPTPGSQCLISIDPTDAADLVVKSYGSNQNQTGSYRSRDGGQTWSLLRLPAGDNPAALLVSDGWAGSSLFVGVTNVEANGVNIPLAHTLAVSVNGGALTWADNSSVFHSHDYLRTTFAIGTTYYRELSTATCQDIQHNPQCLILVKTSDNGATWTTYTPPSQVTFISGTLADGHTLLGDINSLGIIGGVEAISEDAGQRWTALPLFQSDNSPQHGLEGPFSAPDGTIFVLHGQGVTGPTQMFKLLPGASAWVVVTTMPPVHATYPFVVSATSTGHPNAVWNADSDPGIAYHAA